MPGQATGLVAVASDAANVAADAVDAALKDMRPYQVAIAAVAGYALASFCKDQLLHEISLVQRVKAAVFKAAKKVRLLV